MDPWIQAAKNQITEIITKLRKEYQEYRYEVALVGYRDYGDREQFIIRDFTDDKQIVEFLKHIRADGGDDEAEDVAEALDATSKLSWNTKEGICSIFHIADAPAHGMKYHTPEISDRYPRGDPHSIDPCLILRRLSMAGIDYTFIKIKSTTDIMIRLFYETYTNFGLGEFTVIDLRYTPDPTNMLTPSVLRSVTRSITQHTSYKDQELE
jgi:hypothetical protein